MRCYVRVRISVCVCVRVCVRPAKPCTLTDVLATCSMRAVCSAAPQVVAIASKVATVECERMCVHVCVYVCVCMFVCVFVCVCSAVLRSK
jgi:hypothetical protein